MKYEKTITTEQEAVLKTNMIDIQEYFDNAVNEKVRRLTDKIVEKSGRGSRFTPEADKIKIIKELIKDNSPMMRSAKEKEGIDEHRQ